MISHWLLVKIVSNWYHLNMKRMWYKLKTINPYPLRIDEELMEELKKLADKHSRSVNKKIEFLIKEAINKEKELITNK